MTLRKSIPKFARCSPRSAAGRTRRLARYVRAGWLGGRQFIFATAVFGGIVFAGVFRRGWEISSTSAPDGSAGGEFSPPPLSPPLLSLRFFDVGGEFSPRPRSRSIVSWLTPISLLPACRPPRPPGWLGGRHFRHRVFAAVVRCFFDAGAGFPPRPRRKARRAAICAIAVFGGVGFVRFSGAGGAFAPRPRRMARRVRHLAHPRLLPPCLLSRFWCPLRHLAQCHGGSSLPHPHHLRFPLAGRRRLARHVRAGWLGGRRICAIAVFAAVGFVALFGRGWRICATAAFAACQICAYFCG